MIRKVRFGVMCDGSELPAWESECVKRLLAMENVSLELLIQPGQVTNQYSGAGVKPSEQSTRLQKLVHGRHLWKKYSKSLARSLTAMRIVDLTQEFSGVKRLTCDVVKRDRFSRSFSLSDIELIQSYELDFILRFAFGIVRGDILNAARYGLWSFHHGDEREYRGSPAGFWEIVDRKPTTGAILQRITDKLDGGAVLQRGVLETGRNYRNSLDALLWSGVDWPSRLASQLLNGESLPMRLSESSAPIRRSPTNWQFLKYATSHMTGRVAKSIRQTFFEYREIWNVGLIDRSIQSVLEQPSVDGEAKWLNIVSSNRFAADPFGLYDRGGRLHVLFEDYDYSKSRGVISAASLREDGEWELTESVISVAEHLSYPYLLVHDGAVVCIPESASRNETVLLFADNFPDRWSEPKIVMEDIGLVDPTLFHHNGRWWLFATKQVDCGMRIDSLKLFAWFADSIEGPWIPHALNPLKTDVRGARPAGTPFLHEGKMYRPGQDCSETYGGCVRLFEVVELSPSTFEEVEVQVVRPPKEWRDGLHTLSAVGDKILIDAKKKVYVFRGWRSVLRRMFTKP